MPVKIFEDKNQITKFIHQHPVGVVATADSSGTVHAATVYFVADDQLNIYFVTKEQTQKAKNLQQNPSVALALYDAENQTTLQVQGTASILKNIGEFMGIYNQILDASTQTSSSERSPVSKLNAGDYLMYCIKPRSLRLAEYTNPDHGDFDIFREVK